jgi:CBS domain-containing protein
MSKSKKIKHYLAGQRYWEVFVVDVEEKVGHACELMEKNRIGALIVVDKKTDAEHSHVVGIVTERDIVKTISHHLTEIEDKTVDEIMTHSVISTTPEATSEEAISLMVENQIRHLAVMEGDILLGVISMRDLFYSLNYLSK